jgi:hypothetical protein
MLWIRSGFLSSHGNLQPRYFVGRSVRTVYPIDGRNPAGLFRQLRRCYICPMDTRRITPDGSFGRGAEKLDSRIRGMMKITGQIWLRDKLSVSDLESSSLAGYCRHIRSNLCTRP